MCAGWRPGDLQHLLAESPGLYTAQPLLLDFKAVNNLFLKYYKRWDSSGYKRSLCTNNVDNPSVGIALQAIETQADQMSWAHCPRAVTSSFSSL